MTNSNVSWEATSGPVMDIGKSVANFEGYLKFVEETRQRLGDFDSNYLYAKGKIKGMMEGLKSNGVDTTGRTIFESATTTAAPIPVVGATPAPPIPTQATSQNDLKKSTLGWVVCQVRLQLARRSAGRASTTALLAGCSAAMAVGFTINKHF